MPKPLPISKQRLNIVQDATVSNEGRIESLEKADSQAGDSRYLMDFLWLTGTIYLNIV